MVTDSEAGKAAYEESIKSPKPVGPDVAAETLMDVKRIMDELGVVFFLRQGTCLGAVRDKAFISWDDDLDLGSVLGLHGLTEEMVDRAVDAFAEDGYYVEVGHTTRDVSISFVKLSVRTDWTCHRITGDTIFQYPGIKTPLALFTQLEEIDFIGEKFLVPNPPEEYLRLKYGPDWKTPKGAGLETDVVQKIPDAEMLSRKGRFSQFLTKHVVPWRAGRIKILDREGEPVNGAEVAIVGVGRSKTNKQGYARFYVPDEFFYAVIVRFDGYEELLYLEVLTPGRRYVYRQASQVTSSQDSEAEVRSMALSRE